MEKDIERDMQETNPDLVLNADNVILLEKKDAQEQGVPLFTAHWHLFAPTIVILFGYSFSWLALAVSGYSGTNLSRLFIIVMAIFVPLLAAHAFLRYQTIRLQINEERLTCHPGWPKDLPVDVPFELIEKVRVKRGLSGRLFGGGTLVLDLSAENQVVIADLSTPEKARIAILEAIGREV